jgi:DNA polymerase V
LIRSGQLILEDLFRPGYQYRKLGVLLSGLVPAENRQLGLGELDQGGQGRHAGLMQAVDHINSRFGAKTLQVGLCPGQDRAWEMKREQLSRPFTTSWQDLPRAS